MEMSVGELLKKFPYDPSKLYGKNIRTGARATLLQRNNSYAELGPSASLRSAINSLREFTPSPYPKS